MRNLLIFLVVFSCQLPQAFGQALSPGKLKGESAKQVEVVRKHFKRFSLRSVDSDQDMEMLPVLFWNAPSRGASDGKMVTVLFVENGRPEAACCVYPPIPSSRMTHEFGSLSFKPLRLKLDGVQAWNPDTRGVEFKSIGAGRPPSKKAAARMSEMKHFARQFDVEILWRGLQREHLRLLSQPLYRYEVDDSSELLDGAVFCFVMGGVDPEALLIIEAVRANADKEPKWQYAFARRSSAQITAFHKVDGESKKVWSTTQLQGTGRKDPFIQLGVSARQ